MISLPDVNVLLSLLDKEHRTREPAWAWFREAVQRGWATCPFTENAVVRILSNPAYPNLRLSVPDAAELLRQFIEQYQDTHYFWADEVSLLDRQRFDLSVARGHKQLTDVYLLGLCYAKGGRLVTFDGGVLALVPCVRGAGESLVHLLASSGR
jgi:toxin-antitoxin system PIN domain toxin